MCKPNIAITLSGGGYRAAAYHLGTLSYLNHLTMSDGRKFLDYINIMSTISGGTITGLWYMMHLCKGTDVDKSLRELYNLLLSSDIPSMGIDRYIKNQDMDRPLIRVLADVYDDIFFHGECFSTILNNIDRVHFDYFHQLALIFIEPFHLDFRP